MFVVFTPEAFANGINPSSYTFTKGQTYSSGDVNIVCTGIDSGGIQDGDGGAPPAGMTGVSLNEGNTWGIIGTPTTASSGTYILTCDQSDVDYTFSWTVVNPPAPTPTYLILGGLVKLETGSIGDILLTGLVQVLTVLSGLIGLGILMYYFYKWVSGKKKA